MMKIKKEKVSNKELRSFGFITGAISAVLFGLLFPLLSGNEIKIWPWIVGGVLALMALVVPAALLYVYRVWMAIGDVLGWINTKIILGLMFFIVITPMGLIVRLLGKDPMNKRDVLTDETYRIVSSKRDKSHVKRLF